MLEISVKYVFTNCISSADLSKYVYLLNTNKVCHKDFKHKTNGRLKLLTRETYILGIIMHQNADVVFAYICLSFSQN